MKERTGTGLAAAASGKHYGSTDKHQDKESVVDLSPEDVASVASAKQLTATDGEAADTTRHGHYFMYNDTEWHILAGKLDRIFFWLFLFLNVGAIVACFLVYPANSQTNILFEPPTAVLNKTMQF